MKSSKFSKERQKSKNKPTGDSRRSWPSDYYRISPSFQLVPMGGVGIAIAIARPPVSGVLTAIFFLLIALSWNFCGCFLGGTNRGSFSLGLALKTPLERNKVVRLCLFWFLFWIQALGFHLLRSIMLSFSLASLFISCLVLPLLINIVDLVYV